MNRQVALIAIAITAVLVGVVALTWRPRDSEREAVPGQAAAPLTASEALASAETWTVDLYFPGAGGRLYAEQRDLPASGEVNQRIAELVSALLAGPRAAATHSPLPEGVSLRKVYLIDGGTVFLDLESPDGAPPPPSGSWREMQTVYSLVDTVLLNVAEAEQLVLLWNGRQLETFAGHLDTMRPLTAQPDLIAHAP